MNHADAQRWIFVAVLLFGVAIAGCGTDAPPQANAPPNAQPAPPPQLPPAWADLKPPPPKDVEGPSLAGTKAELEVGAEDLFKAFKDDQQAAAQKYVRKVIEVKGTIEGVGRLMYPPAVFTYRLKAGKGTVGLDTVMVNVEGEDALERAQPGQEAVFRGEILKGDEVMPYLHRGTIVSASGEPCPRLTTAELKEQVAADPAAFKAKHERKYLFVSGKVGFFAQPENGTAIMVKEGDALISLNLDLPEQHGTLKELKPGDPFTVLIQVSPYHELTAKKIHLREGLIVTGNK